MIFAMNRSLFFLSFVVHSFALSGCGPTHAVKGRPGDVLEVSIKGRSLSLEVASDDLARRVGLMTRKSMPENSGMLFIFPEPRLQSFWMKNTLIPLSVAFLDDGGKILQIEDMQPNDETNTVSKTPVRFAIEVNQGWFRKNGIAAGDSLDEFAEKVRYFRGN